MEPRAPARGARRTAGPEQHRLIYVHAADAAEETSARLVAVQQLASQIAPNNLPPVMPTSIADDGWSAGEVDAIGRKYIGSIPTPRLPPPTSGATSTAGGAGSTGSP